MEISIRQDEDLVSVKLAGVINEDNDLADHLERIVGSFVVIDLSEIERINSCGVRDWVNWIGALEAKGSEMLFTGCSPSIVAQINLVNNFTGSGQIKSIYLPYYCDNCNEEHTLLYEAEELASEQLPPQSRCNGCERFMDFDDMPDAYFAFLSNREQLLFSDVLSQDRRLQLADINTGTPQPVFPMGSTNLPGIDELLEEATRTEIDAVNSGTVSESSVSSKPRATRIRNRKIAELVLLGLLSVGAAIALQFLW